MASRVAFLACLGLSRWDVLGLAEIELSGRWKPAAAGGRVQHAP